MIRLPKTVDSRETPRFSEIFKGEVENLDAQSLPLQEGLSLGSSVAESRFSIMVLSDSEEADTLNVKAGIFYKSVISGCSCADDPTPIDEQTEYCEVHFEIDKQTAEAKVSLVAEKD